MHAEAAMKGLEHGPPHLLSALQRHAELVPVPRIGHDSNVAFTNMQLNIAPVEKMEDVDGESSCRCMLI